ncbi:hypothetical protein [Bosea sp. 2RAB26]|uniref:hypothetical protein n=1 Tax=Bosea sp. 2RAB26 TaxID=3237476 RepID=UPI003F8FD9C0
MKALTKTEREALLTELDEFNTRLVAKRRERDEITGKKAAIARDVVTGKAGAKTAALELDDTERDLAIEIGALETAIADSQQHWDDDAPHRDREHKEARRQTARERALEVLKASDEADEALRAFVAALEKRHAAADAFRTFIDLTDNRSVQQVSGIVGTALAAAGIRKFDTTFQLIPGGCGSIAEHDAQTLGAVLPDNHPAVRSNRKRQEAAHAEYLRQRGL